MVALPAGTEIATFLIGGQLLGVAASQVIECIEVASAVRVWRGGFAQRHVGFVTWNDMALPLIDIAADVGNAAVFFFSAAPPCSSVLAGRHAIGSACSCPISARSPT